MQEGINLQRNHGMNQVDFYSEAIQDSAVPLTSLPPHIIGMILSRLPIKDLLNISITCSYLRNYTDSLPIWCDLDAKLQGSLVESKRLVVAKINDLFNLTRSHSEQAMRAHIKLSQIGLSSLAHARASASQILIKEEERRAHPSSPFRCESYHDKSVPLIEAYLQNNDLDQAEEMIQQMYGSTMRGVLAFRLEKSFLERRDFQRALSALRLIKVDQLESGQALSLFIWNAKIVATIDLALQALNDFANFRTAHSCAKDFHGFLMEVGEVQKAVHLQESHPDAFSTDILYSDVEYFACNNQMEKAIEVAAALTDFRERASAIISLKKIMREKGAFMENGQDYLNRIKILKANLIGDFLW